VTITNLPPDRPIPDADDLRLLAELINNVSIPLANAAWNARMSQAEAAARLVSMAERGLPLRLVADGDRTALWHIAQAGPAVGTAPAQPAQPVPAVQAVAADALAAPAAAASPEPGPASDAAPSDAGAAPSMTSMTMFAEAVPEVSAAPPAPDSAGGTAVPVDTAVPVGTSFLATEAPPALPVAMQVPGTPDLSEHESEPAQAPHAPEHEAGESEAPQVSHAQPSQPATEPEPTAEPQAEPGPAAAEPQPAAVPQPIAEPQPATPSAPRWAQHHVTGPAAEQLLVTIVEVRDPGDEAMAAAGRPIAPGYRAILVRSWVANVGSVFYPASADANLVVETDRHELLGRSGPPPAPYPGFAIGIGPGQAADGWSLFIVPSGTVLAGLKWCIRPDIPQTIVGWPITP